MSRRTLLKGAAWSLPVIAVAVSSPTASASPGTATVEWTSGAATLLSLRALSTGDVLALDVIVVTFLSNGVPFGSLSGVNITVPVGAGLI